MPSLPVPETSLFISNPLESTNGYMMEIYLLNSRKGREDQQNYLKSIGLVILL